MILGKMYPNLLKVHISDETKKDLADSSSFRGIPQAVLVREIIQKHFQIEKAMNLKPVLKQEIMETVEGKLGPVEDRIAKMMAMAFYMNTITMYMQNITLNSAGKSKEEVLKNFKNAKEKAVGYTGATNTEELEEFMSALFDLESEVD